MQLLATIGVIVAGLVIVNVDNVPPDMHLYGWILFTVGVLGLLLRFMLSRAGRDQDRRRRPREPGR